MKNLEAIKEVISGFICHIVMNERVENQILDIIKKDAIAACALAKEVEFKEDVDEETRIRIKRLLSLLALELCIEDNKPAMEMIKMAYEEHLPFLDVLIGKTKELAEAGNGMALFMMGCCYQDGIGVEKDSEKAISYFLNAAVKGNNGGTFKVALDAFRRGDMFFSDALLQHLAKKDDKFAMCSLSIHNLITGVQANKDISNEIEQLRENPISKKIIDVSFILCYYYLMGEYVEVDEKTGFEFLHICADNVDEQTKEHGGKLLDICLILHFKLYDLLDKLVERSENVVDYNEQPLVDYLKVLDFILKDLKKE